MNIPIYKAEIEAGLEESIKASASCAYVAPVRSFIPTRTEEEQAKIIALKTEAENKEQLDLYYINSVLVSTGWNKNDDVFDAQETWTAKDTPEDKQFNFMHDETDIIGHITGNVVLDRSGNEVKDLNQLSDGQFDIITSAVLYNSWTDPKLKARMAKIIDQIESDEWFVSMEALFAGFDYAIVDPDGQHKTIARNEESAFLTKHLRAYGGQGEYEGHKIGRLLRNITFSGKGLVSKPANPRSVIITDSDPFRTSEIFAITHSSLRENQMSDLTLETQVQELKAQLVEAKAAEEALKAEISSQKDEEFKVKIEAFEATVAEKDSKIVELNEAIEASKAQVTELEATLAQAQEELTQITAKVEAHEAEAKREARKVLLAEAGLEDEDVEAALEKFAEVSDELFEEFAGYMKKKANFPPKKDDEEEDEEKEDAKSSEETEVEAEEQDEAEVEAEAEILEEVEEEVEATLTDAGDDSVAEARTSASDWLESNVLRTTASLQD